MLLDMLYKTVNKIKINTLNKVKNIMEIIL